MSEGREQNFLPRIESSTSLKLLSYVRFLNAFTYTGYHLRTTVPSLKAGALEVVKMVKIAVLGTGKPLMISRARRTVCPVVNKSRETSRRISVLGTGKIFFNGKTGPSTFRQYVQILHYLSRGNVFKFQFSVVVCSSGSVGAALGDALVKSGKGFEVKYGSRNPTSEKNQQFLKVRPSPIPVQ